jgi:hypothetical protein
VVPADGDAGLTDLPCPRSASPTCSVGFCRRSPSAARSLLKNPPVRASWTCGASSGRRLMAPASLHNSYEAARGTRERRSSTPGAWMARRERQLIPERNCGPAAPTTECRKPGQHRSSTRYRPRSFPRSRSNLQHRPDDTPVDRWCPSGWSNAAGRVEFAPVHPIAGGSGGRSQRSLP